MKNILVLFIYCFPIQKENKFEKVYPKMCLRRRLMDIYMANFSPACAVHSFRNRSIVALKQKLTKKKDFNSQKPNRQKKNSK